MAENIENTGKNTELDVKTRLLDVGEAVFAEKGFDGVSVRQLTTAAGCNLAAINYYFGGKHELYGEVIRRLIYHVRDIRIAMVSEVIESRGDELTLEELLMAFSSAFVEPLVGDNQGRRFFKIISWEMLRPVISKKVFVEEMVKPVVAQMAEALINLLPSLSNKKVILCIESLVGQLMHTIHINQAFKDGTLEDFFIKDMNLMVNHIVKFTAAGIRVCAAESNDEK